MTWPPADTDRNRFLFRAGAVAGVLATVYLLLFALQTGAFVPWFLFTVALAATLVDGVGLLLMHEQRRRAQDPAGPPSPRSGH